MQPLEEREKLPDWILTVRQCERLRYRIREGMKLACRIMVPGEDAAGRGWERPKIVSCRVQKMYRHICLTDKGCFSWVELAYLNMDLLR